MSRSIATNASAFTSRPHFRLRLASLYRSRQLQSWLSTLVLLLAWHLASTSGYLNARTLPGPLQVLETALDLTLSGALFEALAVSTARVLAGSIMGILVGLSLGLIAGFSRLGEAVVDKPLQMLRTIPFTALVPLLILWFGIDETPKVLLVALGVLIPLYVNTFRGIRNVDIKLIEVARVARMSRLGIATRVLLPAALPTILIGLRFALGLGWIAVIVAETVGANSGIGFLLNNARQYVRTDVMLVCVSLYAILGLVTDYAVSRLEKVLLSWRVVYTG
ncbi:sulfonate transport system permease protein [Paucimonas lemoignei]|uniref:Sulfonate transport system permease protein n=1 Tax=Paucimonas lemoignei TaxID=29443 RepID=A0A4R3HYR0_PAULE|nr:ABC transporter permease subunit [Paucimonas lemoignei]TCS38004.1 sulfonate transport system permease protein [Paucimonas lemoignei]